MSGALSPNRTPQNVVQIQRIKLVPVNDAFKKPNETLFLNTQSRLGSGGSPRGTHRDSIANTVQYQQYLGGSKSLFLGAPGASAQASRYHSTQRSSFLQGSAIPMTTQGTSFLENNSSDMMNSTFNNNTTSTLLQANVDKELPLKFKPFKKVPA